ncbi:MAG TPA: GNAT family N-acetyltransferase [Clostridia bacterium]|nr:GNAT family N-acetyltransferase [Clostridia bacterium]
MELTSFRPGDDEWIASMMEEAPAYLRRELLKAVRRNPEHTRLAVVADRMVGAAVHTAGQGDDRANICVYTAASYRRLGIGSRLLQAMENDLRDHGIPTAMMDFDRNEEVEDFVKKRGYALKYASHLMRYEGEPIVPDRHFMAYEDGMYERVQGVISRALYPLRKRLNIQPYAIPPSQADREEMAEHAEDYYVYVEDQRIVAVGCAADGEISNLCVEEAYRGRGIGKALVAYGIEKLRREGMDASTLWVMESNENARRLYGHMGFATVRVHGLYAKALI